MGQSHDPSYDEDGHVRLSLGAYVLMSLPAAQTRIVEAHLAHCARCSIECAELAEASASLAVLRDEPLDDVRSSPPRSLQTPDPPVNPGS